MENIDCIPYKLDHTREYHEIRLVKAAVVDSNDKVYTGWRHSDILQYMKSIGCEKRKTTDDQGFVDELGNYYRRIACKSIVYRNGQLNRKVIVVFSEDLWDKYGNPRDPNKPYDPMGDK